MITVVNSGYVGIIAAVCLCEFGFKVCIVESDARRLEMLKHNSAPSQEPGVKQLLEKHTLNKTISFSDDLQKSVRKSDAIFV
jgi:UDPglucose 6-dehydrogenase